MKGIVLLRVRDGEGNDEENGEMPGKSVVANVEEVEE